MGKYKEYHLEAVKALNLYSTEQFIDVLNRIETYEGEKYYDKSILPRIIETAEKSLSEIGNDSSNKGVVYSLLKNPVIDFSLGVLGEHVLLNQQQINDFFKNLKGKQGRSLYDMRYDESLFLAALTKSKNYGLFGEQSGTKSLLDKLMHDLPEIAGIFSYKNPDVMTGLLALSSLGLTPESIRDSYQQGSFFREGGILEKIVTGLDSPQGTIAIELGKIKLQEFLKLKLPGIDLSEVDLQNYMNSYRLYGLDDEKGLMNVVSTSILSNYSNLGGEIFSLYARKFAQKDIKAVEEIFSKLGYSRGKLSPPEKMAKETLDKFNAIKEKFSEKEQKEHTGFLIEYLESKKVDELVEFARKNPPLLLQDNHLLTHIKNYGVIGENGLFAYLRECIPEILAPFKKARLIDNEQIEEIRQRHEDLSKITEASEMFVAFSHNYGKTFRKNEIGEGSIELAQKAEELDITPYEFLSSEQYSEEKRKLFDKSFEICKKLTEHLPGISAKLEDVLISNDLPGKLEQEFPPADSKLKKSALSYVRFLSENPEQETKIRDYLRLIKDFSKYAGEKSENTNSED